MNLNWLKPGLIKACDRRAWRERAKFVAGYIPVEAVVLDLGCGNMLLKEYLGEKVKYFPLDIAKRDEHTFICDLDKDELPEVKGLTDITCIGVLPHLENQPAFLHRLCVYASENKAVVYISHKEHSAEMMSEKNILRVFEEYFFSVENVELKKHSPVKETLYIGRSTRKH